MSDPQCDSRPNTLCKTYLTRGQTLGLMVNSEAGLLSAAAVLALFGMMIHNAIRHYKNNPDSRWQRITSPFQVYMLSLFVGEFIQGLGIALILRWVVKGTVACGRYCTAQGVVQQLGEAIVAMSTLAIAVHTFVIILFRRGKASVLFATFVVCSIWVYVILFISISTSLHTRGGVYLEVPTPYWCFIGSNFMAERIAGLYFWFWFTGLTSLILYVILYFCLRGNIYTEEKRWWRIRFRRQPKSRVSTPVFQGTQKEYQEMDQLEESDGAAKTAFIMLLYPVCYVGLILPLSIVRWIQFVHESADPNDVHPILPSLPVIFVQTMFGLSGLVNVTLFSFTRPCILLLGEAPMQSAETVVSGASNNIGAGHQASPNSLRLRLAPTPQVDTGVHKA